MIRLGRALVSVPTTTASDTVVVVELVNPSSSEDVTDQVAAAGATLPKVVTVPPVSDSVKLPAKVPVRVRSSAPGSGTHPPPALAVKWIASSSASTTSSDVAEVWRMKA